MAEALRGKPVGDEIKNYIKNRVAELEKEDKYPKLAIVRLGDNPDDVYYERSILKNCESLGIKTDPIQRDASIDTEELINLIEDLNNDDSVSGILVFRPLPNHIDEDKVIRNVSPEKDVDSMNPISVNKLFEGDMSGFAPCTPKAAMEILKYYGVDLEGKNVVVINRSLVVGKPLAMMLLEENATVTICHSRTKNLSEITKSADVVMTALGRAKMFGIEYFNEDSIVIDIGISNDEEGKMSGDVDYNAVEDLVKMVTPVPGGVGSVTTSLLLKNVVDACK